MYGQQGFHYVEVIIATLLIAVALVPAISAVHTGLKGSVLPAERLTDQYWLVAGIEETLAQPFSSLDAAASVAGNRNMATSYSDAIGSARRRLVYLSRYDGDNADGDDDGFTGTDAGLIWIRVELENAGLAVESLIARD